MRCTILVGMPQPKGTLKQIVQFQIFRKQSEISGLDTPLQSKVNARVMITANIDVSDRFTNGQLRTIKHLETKEKKISTIYLSLDDTLMTRTRINGNDLITKNNRWVPIGRDEVSICLNCKYKTTSPTIQRTQLLPMLSWACTVHKVQGLS